MDKQPIVNADTAHMSLADEMDRCRQYSEDYASQADAHDTMLDRFVHSQFFPARVVGTVALVAYANAAGAVESIKKRLEK
jgi:hypothetical protein